MPTDHSQRVVKPSAVEFPEFTSKLVTDTFDALVAAMIRQQESYADLVEKAAMTIGDFEAEAVADGEVDDWLATTFPAESGAGSAVGTVAEPGDLEENDVARLTLLLGATATDMEIELPSSAGSLDGADVTNIRSVVRRKVARPRLEALRELVAQGIVRIVVEDGTVETSLKFDTWSTETEMDRASKYDRDSYGFGGRAGFLSSLFGISGSGHRHGLTVSTNYDSRSADSGVEAQIRGRVKINFRGDYQPLAVPVAEEEEVVAVAP